MSDDDEFDDEVDEDIDDLCHPISRDDACDGRDCGVEGDGCGRTYDCGSCDRGDVCGLESPSLCGTPPDGGPKPRSPAPATTKQG